MLAHPGIHGGWITVVHHYHSDMAQNFWTAIWAFSANLLVTVVVSLLQPSPAGIGAGRPGPFAYAQTAQGPQRMVEEPGSPLADGCCVEHDGRCVEHFLLLRNFPRVHL
jgi:hypothetical protein